MYPIVYDLNMQQQAILENAFAIGYTLHFNEAPSASFSLPANDPKVAECTARRYVELFDGDRRIDLFRIMPTETVHDANGQTVTFHCEHVLATLLDDLVTDDSPIVNNATSDVLSFLLSFQTSQNWRLGTVDFAFLYSYQWSWDNVLSALFSVTKPFAAPYMWTWDTATYPWRLNLTAPSNSPKSRARTGLNLAEFREDNDPTKVITRLYPLGYGEGVNQLRVTDVNPTGLPYIDAPQAVIDEYGIVAAPFVDRSIRDAQTLFDVGQANLARLSTPRVAYSMKAADLSRITGESVDEFRVGDVVRVTDDVLEREIEARIVTVGKRDVDGAPGDVDVEIANKTQSLEDDIADINRRQLVTDLYAQGATNIDSQNANVNCDPAHPAVIRFWVPQEAEKINRVNLTYESVAFQSFSKTTKAAGAATVTSASGGSSTQTSSSGGSVSKSTASGGSSTQTSAAGGNHRHLMFQA
ncbi:MAG TPA: phage tail spike protein, partial [Bacillales bacterium]|nr:phage tail spike protein [Bacillales bacterium]